MKLSETSWKEKVSSPFTLAKTLLETVIDVMFRGKNLLISNFRKILEQVSTTCILRTQYKIQIGNQFC